MPRCSSFRLCTHETDLQGHLLSFSVAPFLPSYSPTYVTLTFLLTERKPPGKPPNTLLSRYLSRDSEHRRQASFAILFSCRPG